MKNKPLVSVIMPVFNTEEYVEASINSILDQTYPNIELICINDGSTDNSLNVLSQKASVHSNVKVYSQSNKGLSATRNRGIDLANGDYIYFFDSDDLLLNTGIESLVKQLEESETSVVFFEADVIYEGDLNADYKMNYTYSKLKTACYSTENLIQTEYLFSSSCLMMLKRSVILENNLYFLEGAYHEDELFQANLLCLLEYISVYKELLYKRRVRNDSIITSSHLSEKRLQSYCEIAGEIYQLKFKTKSRIKQDYFIKKAIDNYLSALRLSGYSIRFLHFVLTSSSLEMKEQLILILRFLKYKFRSL